MSRCSVRKTSGLKKVKTKGDFRMQFSPSASVFVECNLYVFGLGA